MGGRLGLPPIAVDQLDRYRQLLAAQAIPRGFLGPQEAGRLLPRHILESVALVAALPARPGPIIDVGTGAGLPGVVLGIATGEPVTLLDADRKRATWLEAILADLQLAGRVVKDRAEVAGRDVELRGRFTSAVARAVAAPAVALELVLPFVAPGGRAVIVVAQDLDPRSLAAACSELGAGAPRVELLDIPEADARVAALVADKVAVTPERYPRRTGIPAKRPLT